MRPSDLKSLKALLSEIQRELGLLRGAIQNSAAEQKSAARDAAETNRQGQEQIQTRLLELQEPENEKRDARSHRDKSHTVQVILAAGTLGAFFAAAVYAGIAGCQWRTMNDTYTEIKRQTKASEMAAYTACRNAQIAQQSLLQLQLSNTFSQETAISSTMQTIAGIESEKANIEMFGRLPEPSEIINHRFQIVYSLSNDGKAEAEDFKMGFEATLLEPGDKFAIRHKNFDAIGANYFGAGEQIPTKPDKGKPVSLTIPVTDIKGNPVLDTSPGIAHLYAGSAVITVSSWVKYSDFAGKHIIEGCSPLFSMPAGTTRRPDPNEVACAKYGHRQDISAYKTLAPTPPAVLNKPEEIKCIAPKD